ncbi:EcsC family protein [Cellulosilyticum sp. I15G10I2]|uniref:EcsC family protein n=1 Tax=Cellulosilyticum sp. I15G10I2 TaxID=1892843 RepID=UPI00085CC27C|nr:EcsC family protein [Cellulosilyticum sp. I15G10I2]
MDSYNHRAQKALKKWQKKMYLSPSFMDKTTKKVQDQFNQMLPERYHQFMTESIKHMTQGVLLGSQYITHTPYKNLSLIERDDFLKEKTKLYSKVAMAEGIGTGAGGILLGFADFPLLLSIKIKFLYDIAAVYGFDTNDYRERLYILYIFRLAFASKPKMQEVLEIMKNWDSYVKSLPYDMNSFDWRTFQQEYRDYIDLAKLLQLVPGIGAIVGAYVNTKLINQLSTTAMYAYHLRLLQDQIKYIKL